MDNCRVLTLKVLQSLCFDIFVTAAKTDHPSAQTHQLLGSLEALSAVTPAGTAEPSLDLYFPAVLSSLCLLKSFTTNLSSFEQVCSTGRRLGLRVIGLQSL